MSFSTPSRRAVVRTAAWAAPAVAVATTAPAFAASTTTYTTAPEKSFSYVAHLGEPDPNNPAGVGTFVVRVSSQKVPATSATGLPIDAPQFTSVVVVPDNLRGLMRDVLGITEVWGTAVATYTGAGTTANLTIPRTPVPTSGDLEITAAGNGQASTAGPAGSVDITIGQIVANLEHAGGPLVITLVPQGVNNFHTYTVA